MSSSGNALWGLNKHALYPTDAPTRLYEDAATIKHMEAPFGAKSVEYIAIRFRPDIKVAHAWKIVEGACVRVHVNGKEMASSALLPLPMEPPMSGRLVFRPAHCPCTAGDDVTARIDGLACGVDGWVEVELSIFGEIEVDDDGAVRAPIGAAEQLLGVGSPYRTSLLVEPGPSDQPAQRVLVQSQKTGPA